MGWFTLWIMLLKQVCIKSSVADIYNRPHCKNIPKWATANIWLQYANTVRVWSFPIKDFFCVACCQKLQKDYSRLIQYIDHHGSVCEYQFRIQKVMSIHLARMALTDKISDSLDESKLAMVIFHDFSKAFCTVDNVVRLQKQGLYGVQDNALKWVIIYLCSRAK